MHVWWFEWKSRWNVDFQVEDPFSIWRVWHAFHDFLLVIIILKSSQGNIPPASSLKFEASLGQADIPDGGF